MKQFNRLVALLALLALALGGREVYAQSTQALPPIKVYKNENCRCCGKWVDYLRERGFRVEEVKTSDAARIRNKHRVPSKLASCHTAVVDGYVVEGHVPADVIQKLLIERPEVTGIAAPGMPMGSPGMEGPRSQSYEVIAFTRDGREIVYARR